LDRFNVVVAAQPIKAVSRYRLPPHSKRVTALQYV
jgi:hypothetical protein